MSISLAKAGKLALVNRWLKPTAMINLRLYCLFF